MVGVCVGCGLLGHKIAVLVHLHYSTCLLSLANSLVGAGASSLQVVEVRFAQASSQTQVRAMLVMFPPPY